jgi:hypothetical protein
MASPRSDDEVSARRLVAYGTTAFAGVMLATVGVFQVLEGLSALAKDQVYATGLDYVFRLDITGWGWIHLLIGLVAVAIAIGILLGPTWGRIGGIAIAVLSSLSNFAFLPYEPVWALVVIAFNGLVIWALCVQLRYDDRW